MQSDGTLAAGVKELRPFLPARDFPISLGFSEALGFRPQPHGEGLAELHFGSHSFLLQNYYVAEVAGISMMHVLVADLDAWWERVVALDLPTRFGVSEPRPPKAESWGPAVACVTDPSGVFWHTAQMPVARSI